MLEENIKERAENLMGSMTGAPKLHNVNDPNTPNNHRCGAHFSVVIRTVIICDEKDLSNPEMGWQEVLLKLQYNK
ncbi:19742_t:CDS:2, partial [Entrophospora sp. SA101]